jgi:uncharacterized membrane protein YqhA
MKKLLESSVQLNLIAVLASLAASLAAFAWGTYRAGYAIYHLLQDFDYPLAAVAFVEVMDAFLIAIGLYIFAVAIYELFIGDLNLPPWLQIHDLYHLKLKLISIIVLVMGIKFLEKFAASQDADATLRYGVAFAVATAALIGFAALIKDE